MSITHLKRSLKTNSSDSTKIQPSDWNDEHVYDISQDITVALSNIHVDNEIPVGTKNGTNATFTLTNIPNPISSLLIFLNGVQKANGVGYTIIGNTITMIEIPYPGDDLRCWYRK